MKIKPRLDHELPEATAEWGWRYHHTGIPTSVIMPDEKSINQFKFYVSGFSTSPFGIECQTVPHVAFEVDNIDEELRKHNFKVLIAPNSPSKGVKVAMIEHNNAPVELIEFIK